MPACTTLDVDVVFHYKNCHICNINAEQSMTHTTTTTTLSRHSFPAHQRFLSKNFSKEGTSSFLFAGSAIEIV